MCVHVDFKNTLSSAVMECEEAWDSISCIALSWIRAHFHKVVSMACRGRTLVWFDEKWEELVSTAPDSRLWFGLVRNFGENWEEPSECPRRYIPHHQCPDRAPCWDGDGFHWCRCKFKEKSSKVRSICEYLWTLCMSVRYTFEPLLCCISSSRLHWLIFGLKWYCWSTNRDTMFDEYSRGLVAMMWWHHSRMNYVGGGGLILWRHNDEGGPIREAWWQGYSH